MRIEKIEINNFKSLVEFELELNPFTCLIGLNGSGKSTVLQFIDFAGQLMRGDIDGWLSERGWEAKELKSRLSSKVNIDFTLTIRDSDECQITWSGSFKPHLLRCVTERIVIANRVALHVHSGSYEVERLGTSDSEPSEMNPIQFEYQGSILSQLKPESIPDELSELKRFVSNVRSLDLLAPEQLRRRTRGEASTLGLGGQRLSAFLHKMGPDRRRRLTRRLQEVYRQLDAVNSRSMQYGWKRLEIAERFGDQRITTEARHVNDGLLRLTAILAELDSDHRVVVFDEIENGINAELVEFVIEALLHARAQIVVTTHSPMILNYLEDEVARRSVMYLYKNQAGHTRAIQFFSIPSLAAKLEVMGPGEAFVDTRLTNLDEEIAGR